MSPSSTNDARRSSTVADESTALLADDHVHHLFISPLALRRPRSRTASHNRHVSFDNTFAGGPTESQDDEDDHDDEEPSVDNSTRSLMESFSEFRSQLEEKFEELQEVLEEPITPVKPRETGDHSQKLSALALAVLVFYKVSGGPFGCEPTVRAAGPCVALLGFIVFPFLWCIPEALVTAELGSTFPEPSGAIAWVEEAFGPSAGLLCGYFHWVSGATDNAIYPSLFLEYVASYMRAEAGVTGLTDNAMRFAFCIVMTTILAGINYTGLEIVGSLSIVICIISMSPFVLLCIMGLPDVDPARWWVMPEHGVRANDDSLKAGWLPDPVWMGVLWRPFVNNLFWNLNSFDVGACFAGEVRDPKRVFPRAMFLSILFVVLSYILPLLVAIGATDTDQKDWDAGYLASVASKIGGSWLGGWTVFASAISNIALFEAEMSGDAYQLMGMADRGLIPKVFTKRSRFDTPRNGILLGTFVIFALSVADFDALVEMLNFSLCLSMILEFSAFIKLRITDADVERPFRIPLNVAGCCFFVTPPICICLYIMFIASRVTYLYFAALATIGMSFHLVQKFAKYHEWWEYEVAPPKKTGKTKEPAPSSNGHAPETTGLVA